MPELRAALLTVRPDPAEEFSLLDEAALLFRMLFAGGPAACQATRCCLFACSTSIVCTTGRYPVVLALLCYLHMHRTRCSIVLHFEGLP